MRSGARRRTMEGPITEFLTVERTPKQSFGDVLLAAEKRLRKGRLLDGWTDFPGSVKLFL